MHYFSIYSSDNSTPGRWFYGKINKLVINPHWFLNSQLCWQGRLQVAELIQVCWSFTTELGTHSVFDQEAAGTLSIFISQKKSKSMVIQLIFSSNIPNTRNTVSSFQTLCNVLIDLWEFLENFIEHSYTRKCDLVQLEQPLTSQDTCLLTSTFLLFLSFLTAGLRSTFLHEKTG